MQDDPPTGDEAVSGLPEHWLTPKNEPVEKPYPSPLEPGVICRVEMARSAMSWKADIEAYLVEQELTTDLAETVAKLMDVSGWNLPTTVAHLRLCLKPEHGGTYVEDPA
jgi:hypothetical protein